MIANTVGQYEQLMGMGVVYPPELQDSGEWFASQDKQFQEDLKTVGWDKLTEEQKDNVFRLMWRHGGNTYILQLKETGSYSGTDIPPHMIARYIKYNPYNPNTPNNKGNKIDQPPPERSWYEKLWNNINQKEVWWVVGGVAAATGATYLIMRK